MKLITTSGGYTITKPIDVILLTCNRKALSKKTIEELHNRTTTPIRLTVLDNDSYDGTKEMLQELDKEGKIYKLLLWGKDKATRNLAKTYTECFKYVESEYFLMMQDDVVVPHLEPDVIEQLIDLMEKYPDHGGIGCRIQRISNVKWLDKELTPARKALSAYCRIQKKEDVESMGGFSKKDWDDVGFVDQMRIKFGKECSWATNLWADHMGYMLPRMGYPEGHLRGWGWSEAKITEYLRKPYPKLDPKTNIPLPGEKCYR